MAKHLLTWSLQGLDDAILSDGNLVEFSVDKAGALTETIITASDQLLLSFKRW